MGLRHLIFFCFLAVANMLAAQQPPFAKSTVEKNKILLGEPLLLTIEAELPAGGSGALLSLDSLEHFEFLSPPVIDSSKSSYGIKVKGDYRITSFDSGRWVLPAIVLAPGVQTNTVDIDVVFSDFNPEQDYHDIKDIEDVKPPKKKTPWWWIAGSGLILLLLGALVYYMRKKQPVITGRPLTAAADPYKEAVEQLRSLRSQGLTGKPFHAGLSDIFRLYVFKKKGILSLQKTTDDLILQLKSQHIPAEIFEKMAQALRLGDYVKFAKYMATEEDNDFSFNAIAKAIDAIHQQGQTGI